MVTAWCIGHSFLSCHGASVVGAVEGPQGHDTLATGPPVQCLAPKGVSGSRIRAFHFLDSRLTSCLYLNPEGRLGMDVCTCVYMCAVRVYCYACIVTICYYVHANSVVYVCGVYVACACVSCVVYTHLFTQPGHVWCALCVDG